MKMITRSYSELIQLPSFKERFDYLCLNGTVSEQTFGGHRYLNQTLYHSPLWKSTRRHIIIRDNGCDLGDEDHPIYGMAIIHHINPITMEDIVRQRFCVFDPENLICVSFDTHNALHYGDDHMLKEDYKERKKNDTCPWR